MPRIAKELGALAVSRLSIGRHAVGGVGGLCLLVESPQSKRWVCRILVAGKRRDYGLGGYPTVTLGAAKEAARLLRKQVTDGKDPTTERQAARTLLAANQASAKTFKECAEEFIDAQRKGWKSLKHAAQWSSTLEQYAYPIIGRKNVQDVTTEDALRILHPIWHTKTETASRLRGRIEKILSMAIALGYRKGDNPARLKYHLEHSLPPASKIKKVVHFAALPYSETPQFYEALKQRPGLSASAVEFALLTATRSGEVRGALWSEINLEAGIWTIPGTRMKAGLEHRVPLTEPALLLLKKLPKDGPLCFPGTKKGKPLSDMSLTAVLRRMKIDVTVHGFRSSFRDWAAEQTNFAREVCEAALAHTKADAVEASYFRSDLFEKRRELMNQWVQFISTIPDKKVVQLTPRVKRA